MALLGKREKNEKCPQNALQPFWKNKLKNVLKKRYDPFEKKGKLKNIFKKRYGFSEKKSKKLKNILKKRYGLSEKKKMKKYFGPSGKKEITEKCLQKALRSF